ncbi:protein-disulfide reductase DsbD domain-containing protein [Mycoplana rhizolycopersici]|uniref:Thiol:disulfide interchange protein DsbD N-terminal domain-containing protein n=1 Tax=Mycoplana rhizolycopersici TaxID=2746702 RepID=A0ABX2QF05_9HYPH|nr:protein-disulfide reductase DsbD domain-containing protein [Rhizobium rhizolycopersici]NVP56350.1 hypothetical protein [Rhizobium rhizolycopersici]
MKRFRLLLSGLCVLALSPGMAAAASSPWFETQGGGVRLVVLPEEPDGAIPALLDIKLEPGWKTYWRDPGQSGISPSITFSKESGLTLQSVGFPAPKQFDDGFTRYAGYDRSVALPLTLRRTGAPADGGDISASIFLGMCKNICIPVQADLSVGVKAAMTTDPVEKAIVAAAVAALPAAPSPGFTVTDAHWNKAGDALMVSFTAPEPTTERPMQVFVSGPPGYQFDTSATPVREGDAYRIEVPLRYRPKSANLADGDFLFTAESGGKTLEMQLAID